MLADTYVRTLGLSLLHYFVLQERLEKEQLLGTFTGDVLTTALGNPEHSGRTRGVGSFAPWKTGRNWTLEDKHASKKAKKEQYKTEF